MAKKQKRDREQPDLEYGFVLEGELFDQSPEPHAYDCECEQCRSVSQIITAKNVDGYIWGDGEIEVYTSNCLRDSRLKTQRRTQMAMTPNNIQKSLWPWLTQKGPTAGNLADLEMAQEIDRILRDAQAKTFEMRAPYFEVEKQFRAEIDRLRKKLLSIKWYIVSEAVQKFGRPNPRHPDCSTCLTQSVFPGGPDHEPSEYCRSGKRPHCSCDSCF